MIELCGV